MLLFPPETSPIPVDVTMDPEAEVGNPFVVSQTKKETDKLKSGKLQKLKKLALSKKSILISEKWFNLNIQR